MRRTLTSLAATACAAALAVTVTSTTPATGQPGDRRADAVQDARSAAQHLLGARQALVVKDVVLDADGTSHVRFDRTYRDLPVVGGDLVVHLGKAGALRSSGGRAIGSFSLRGRASLGAERAARIADDQVDYRPDTSTPELVVLAAHRPAALAWRVDVVGRRADGSPAGTYVFVDARSGKVLDSWASEVNASGTGNGLTVGTVGLDTTAAGSTYQLVDPVRGNGETHNGPYASGAPIFTDADNVWGDGTTADPATAAVDAHYGIARTWDFYQDTFGRNGIADDGRGARSYVHDGAYVNASWSDACFCMKYGDGDGQTYLPLVAIDVAGHEMSHGVTSRTAGLTYRGESGGLNEATSDIMGTMVEWYAANTQDVPDYVIGEEVYAQENPATNYIRRMDRPSLDGASQDCWSRRTRSVDVHYSSGPANHFFYLLSEGSGAKTINGVAYNSPTCNGSSVSGIGHDQAAAIWYRALTVYMTSGTDYHGARSATISAATDLYGGSSSQVAAVEAAWAAVNVT